VGRVNGEGEYAYCTLYVCMKKRTMKPFEMVLKRGKRDDGK
jgi:hypothetical protein